MCNSAALHDDTVAMIINAASAAATTSQVASKTRTNLGYLIVSLLGLRSGDCALQSRRGRVVVDYGQFNGYRILRGYMPCTRSVR
jgi:hypothetical protein